MSTGTRRRTGRTVASSVMFMIRDSRRVMMVRPVRNTACSPEEDFHSHTSQTLTHLTPKLMFLMIVKTLKDLWLNAWHWTNLPDRLVEKAIISKHAAWAVSQELSRKSKRSNTVKQNKIPDSQHWIPAWQRGEESEKPLRDKMHRRHSESLLIWKKEREGETLHLSILDLYLYVRSIYMHSIIAIVFQQ